MTCSQGGASNGCKICLMTEKQMLKNLGTIFNYRNKIESYHAGEKLKSLETYLCSHAYCICGLGWEAPDLYAIRGLRVMSLWDWGSNT